MPQVSVTPENVEHVRPAEPPAQENGADDPDAKFFAAAMSIEEGMEKADKAHARSVKVWARIAAAAILVVVGIVGLAAAFNPSSDIAQVAGDTKPASLTAPTVPDNAQDGAPVSPNEEAKEEKPTGRAGTVVYSYTGHVGEGGTYVVTETVEFSDDGTSAQTTIEGTFGDAATAEQFLGAVKRDYGSDFLEGSADGQNVVVKVDISKLGLDREAYEDALRDSVDDLRVVKKS